MKKVAIIVGVWFCLLAIFISLFFAWFKTDYLQEVTRECDSYNIDKNLVFALIKTESGFDKNAVSNAGARGLMQIMPTTASWVCSKIDVEFNQDNLFDPSINIKIGCYYLNYLINLFDGNFDNSICAYNAGQNVVLGWLKDKKYSDDGKTLKNIPYKETRKYLQKVKFNKNIYGKFIFKS